MKTKKLCPKKLCQHDDDKLLYIAAYAEARRRLARGERQWACLRCGRWFWHHELKAS